jgi:hypothetical protein
VPIFHHSEPDSRAGDARQAPAAQRPDYDSMLRYFTGLSLPQRAAEVLRGIAPCFGGGQTGMDQLLNAVCPVPESATRADGPPPPDAWYALRPVLLEAFQALELARLVVRQEETTNHWGTVTAYRLGSDGKAALERGDVADVVARRLPL